MGKTDYILRSLSKISKNGGSIMRLIEFTTY